MAAETFGKYELISKIGTGGMAEIFLARMPGIEGFEKLIVIKRILPHLFESVASESFIQMFLDEARLAARLNHPNIVQIYDLGRVDELYFIAMEYVQGLDLSLLLKKGRKIDMPMSIPDAIKILCYVCEALTYAHALEGDDGRPIGLVHRDISPHNVLLSLGGAVKLTDFGIAKARTQGGKTKTGTIKGKLHYMSPEQVMGEPLDHRSDLFSVGTMLYEMTTGSRPFTGKTDFSVMESIAMKSHRSPGLVRDDYPPGLLPIVDRALAKSADDRFPDALSLQMALESFLLQQQAMSNAALIGKYIKDVFPDLVQAQATSPSTGQEDRAAQLLTGVQRARKDMDETPTETTHPSPLPSPSPEDVFASSAEAALVQPPTGALLGDKAEVTVRERSDSAAAGAAPGDGQTERLDVAALQAVADQREADEEVTRKQELPANVTAIASPSVPLTVSSGQTSNWRRPVLTLAFLGAAAGVLALVLFGLSDSSAAVAADAGPDPAVLVLDRGRVGDSGQSVVSIDTRFGTEPGEPIPPAQKDSGEPAGRARVDASDADGSTTEAIRAQPASASTPHTGSKAKSPPERRPAKKRPGTLTLDAQPWAEVWLSGRRLGITPLAYIEVPAGRHKVVLVNPELKVRKVVWVLIRPDKTTVVKYDLQK